MRLASFASCQTGPERSVLRNAGPGIRIDSKILVLFTFDFKCSYVESLDDEEGWKNACLDESGNALQPKIKADKTRYLYVD